MKDIFILVDIEIGLCIVNLCKSYCKKVVICDVSLMLDWGEVVVLFGFNGCGKIMMFYFIVGLVMLEGGNVIVDGWNVMILLMYCCVYLGIGYLL